MRKHKENKVFLTPPEGVSKHHGFPRFLRRSNSEQLLLANISENRLTWVEPLRFAVTKMGTGIGPPFPGQMAQNVTQVQSSGGGVEDPPPKMT